MKQLLVTVLVFLLGVQFGTTHQGDSRVLEVDAIVFRAHQIPPTNQVGTIAFADGVEGRPSGLYFKHSDGKHAWHRVGR